MFDQQINRSFLADEGEILRGLVERARTNPSLSAQIQASAIDFASDMREREHSAGGLRAFLHHYDLTSAEGVVLMCLAEAVLRIPDTATVDALIADKLSEADWRRHLGESESVFVNASTWALMLTGKALQFGRDSGEPWELLGKLLARLEEPILRSALKAAMEIMAAEFVMGADIARALARTQTGALKGNRFSFDMLGEAALTAVDAKRYFDAYLDAIDHVGREVDDAATRTARPGVSVKLSALYPRFEMRCRAQAEQVLCKRLLQLAIAAKNAGIMLTVDAEEAARLELTIRVFAPVYSEHSLAAWEGLGVAVQAYQKRAMPVLQFLNALAGESRRMIPVRLVKGAYWDSEIKYAQQHGLADFPVFTRKRNTDTSYLACARYLLEDADFLYPQFATHNAHTLAYVYHHGGDGDYEFQRLHGMGEELYAAMAENDIMRRPCRVYAPVGAHADLLPYLVRRLLENGANTSFVHRMTDDSLAIEDIVADPLASITRAPEPVRHPQIKMPLDLYAPQRDNAPGINFDNHANLQAVFDALSRRDPYHATPILDGAVIAGRGRARPVRNPATGESIGSVVYATADDAEIALTGAANATDAWRGIPAAARASCLDTAAQHLYQTLPEIVALCVREAGKTIADAHDELREAIDFLRYYAQQAREQFAASDALPGPAGESNHLRLTGRGVFVCISPWNFPVAIFVGQIAAALAAGNTVIAKPAEQTSLVACEVTRILHASGVPADVLAFLPGDGATLGKLLLDDERVQGVAFTGSTATAQHINRRLARRRAALPTLIAETGGINAMIVDSSALPEQVARDVVRSAFNSAGQRCSALRILCLQAEIAPPVVALITGYLDTWQTGDPADLRTDMGPVIDRAARDALESYVQTCKLRLRYRGSAPRALDAGHFVAPAIIDIDAIADVNREIFGPVLHVLAFPAADLWRIVEDINGLGYGLTFGIHSRIEARVQQIAKRAAVGNVYVNRDMVGAVVESQPFGGCGLSGTGPKAGGPNYLRRFAQEKTVTINTAAVGGNATLLSLEPPRLSKPRSEP